MTTQQHLDLYNKVYDNQRYMALKRQFEQLSTMSADQFIQAGNWLIDACFERLDPTNTSSFGRDAEFSLKLLIVQQMLDPERTETLNMLNEYLDQFRHAAEQCFEPVPLTIEQATHLFKHVCTPTQLADLQDGIDAILSVLTEINGLDYYITRQAKSELETLATALHTVTDEPTVQFEGRAYQISIPTDTQPLVTVPTEDDDLRWLDRFVPDGDKV
jgi:hypothetical protein